MTPARSRRKGAPSRAAAASPRPGAASTAAAADRTWLFWLLGILALTFVVYLPSLDNKFTDWDDNFYVTENPLVAHPDPVAVLTTPVAGNYHPLTIWSLALNYKYAGLDPRAYHWTSVLLHLANTALVFFFVRQLSRGRRWTPIVAAALFGVHPMHVESVAWVAERKDVLYAFFYIAGLIAYLRHVDRKQPAWLAAALVLFVLSAASKPAAVVFPLTILAIDWFRKRRFTRSVWLEKAPFFLVALIDGILTLRVQQSSGAITEHWGPFQKLLFAAYGLVMYVVKLFVPVRLSAIYPYPSLAPGAIGPEYYVMLAAAVIGIPALLWVFRNNRVVLFGFAFYLVNVLLVLQFFSIGGAVMADRYTYVAYIGLFIALAWWLDEPRERFPHGPWVRPALAGVLVLLVAFSAFASWKRADVWQNAETLWNDTIGKYPGRIADAYNNRGFYYYNETKRYDAALADFDQAIALNPNVAKVWLNKGNVLAAMGRNGASLAAFDRAIALGPNLADAWNNRGALKLQMRDNAGAIADCSRALELDRSHRDAYANRSLAYIQLGQFDKAIPDSRRAVELQPARPDNYLQLGTIGFALSRMARYGESVAAFDEAIRQAPPGEPRMAAYYLYRSAARLGAGDKAGALADAREAQRRGLQVDAAYLKKLGA
jgi:tetratricopeptide (TPR) repeat protein